MRFSVHATFETNEDTTSEKLTEAILRAVRTKAFGIAGQVTVDLVREIEAAPIIRRR